MTAVHRASTWPLVRRHSSHVEEAIDDSLVLALLPRSVLNEPRVREAYSRAIIEHWLSRRNRNPEPMVIDWPPSIEVHPLEDRSNSLQVGPRTQYTESNHSALDTTPASPLPENSQPDPSETLQHVGGGFLTVPQTQRTSGCRLAASDGSRTPSSQSVLSLSSDFLYRQGPQSQAETPAYVSWPHPNIDDSIVAHARVGLQSDDQTSVRHLPSFAVPLQRGEARRASEVFAPHNPITEELQENHKRGRSASLETSDDNQNSQSNGLCSECKRRRLDDEDENLGD